MPLPPCSSMCRRSDRDGQLIEVECLLPDHRVADLDVTTHQPSRSHLSREELQADVVERLGVDRGRVGVQIGEALHLDGVVVVERGVLDVLPEDPLAEGDVLLGVQDVSVPERVDLVGDGVLRGGIEQSDGVVLLERQDALVEVGVRGLEALAGQVLARLALDADEVLGVDPLDSLGLERRQCWRDGGTKRALHGFSLWEGASTQCAMPWQYNKVFWNIPALRRHKLSHNNNGLAFLGQVWYKLGIRRAQVKHFPTAHKVKSHLKARAHARAAKKSAQKSLHQVHADNLYKLAHPQDAKRQKAIRRTLTHVVLPIGLIVATASFAVGAEVVQKSSTKSIPPVPANSVCRIYNFADGLATSDNRIGMTFNANRDPWIVTFSGLKLNYMYADDTYNNKYGLGDISGGKLNTGGAAFDYIKACAVNPGPAMAPFTSRSALVDQQYRDFTGAPATATQQAYWANATKDMTAGNAAKYIVTWFATSSDTDAKGNDKRGPLVRLYKAYYKRWPDAGGYDYWVRKMKNGASLASVSDFFAKSSEFNRNYGSLSNEQFVALVYNNVLGRPGDQAGMDYWLNRLNAKKITRGGLMAQFSESSEFKRKYGLDCDLVGVSLRMYRRPATDGELAQWNPDESADTLAYPIIFQSAEYANRVVK